jgi:hypothetical protein
MVAKKEPASLSARVSKASTADEVKSVPTPAKLKPTSDLEPVRFSRRQDLEKHDSPIGKIMMYIVVVVLVGVGLTLLVQSYITSQNANTDVVATDTEPTPVVTIPNATIATAVLADSAASSVNKNELFTSSDLSLGSSSNDASGVNISLLDHEVYTSFTRTSWTLEGLKSGLPASKISYSAADKTVTVTFNGVANVDTGFLEEILVDVGNVESITGTKTDSGITFVLQLSASSKYYAFIVGGNKVVLDIKTDSQLNLPATPVATPTPSPAPAPAPTPTPTPVATGDAPAAPHYDNTMSQSKQYVASKVTGNSVYNDTYFYVDYGDSFQFSWAFRNTGEMSIPNASAELKTDTDGTFYIEIKINNLAQDLLAALGKTEPTVSIPTTSTNYESMQLKSFTGGVSTYNLNLRHKGDFRLHSTQTYEGYQLLGIQLKD